MGFGRLSGSRWFGLSTLLLVLVGIGVALTGASAKDASISDQDAKTMYKNVDRYWAASQTAWPKDCSSGNPKRIPDSVKTRMRSGQTAMAREILTGRLKEWESDFDPGGFLEKARASGTVITASGYEILKMNDPVLVSDDVAQVDFTVRTWGVEYAVDDDGKRVGAPVRPENTDVYRFTFQRTGGKWLISDKELIDFAI